jgi:hypothetical protein
MNTRRRTVARLAALGSSVVLVGVYIGCRASGSSASAPVASEAEGAATQELLFGGSKSAAVFPAPNEPPKNESREFLGGSKSAPVIRPSQSAPQQTVTPRSH